MHLGAHADGERTPSEPAAGLAGRLHDYLARHRDTPVGARELAAALAVSDRTLRRHFARHFGTSPARYLRLRRLHIARRALCAAGAGGSVTQTGIRLGFFDLGRFAGDYRAVFGESPSQTLRGSPRS